MRLINCLTMCTLLSLPLGLKVFRNYYFSDHSESSACELLPAYNRAEKAFICGEKKDIHQAKIAELGLVKGISQRKARLVFSFLAENKNARLDDLLAVKGIGPKTLEKLKELFY
jgi:hypothetical protein